MHFPFKLILKCLFAINVTLLFACMIKFNLNSIMKSHEFIFFFQIFQVGMVIAAFCIIMHAKVYLRNMYVYLSYVGYL